MSESSMEERAHWKRELERIDQELHQTERARRALDEPLSSGQTIEFSKLAHEQIIATLTEQRQHALRMLELIDFTGAAA